MFRSVVVPSSVIVTVIALLTISQLGKSSARSLGLKQGYWPSSDDISKRNSWWSKKSLDSSPDYQTLVQDADTDREITSDARSQPSYSSLFMCYVRECVPKFVQCAQNSATREDYSDCKKRHEVCGMICGATSTEEPLM